MSQSARLKKDSLILILGIIVLLFYTNDILLLMFFIFTIVSFRKFLINCFDFKIIDNISICLIFITVLKAVLTLLLSKLNITSAISPTILLGILTLFAFIEGILIIRFSYLLKYLSNNLFGKLRLLRYIMLILGVIRPIIGLLGFFLSRLTIILGKDIVINLFYIFSFIGLIALLSFLVILIVIYNKFIKNENIVTK